MHAVAHLDPRILEAELLDRVAAARRADPLAPVLVIVPTGRLASHVRRRLAERLGAVAAVEVATHRRVAIDALARAGAPIPRVLPRELSDAVVARTVRTGPRGRIRDFVADRPAALAALAASLRDLREAGVTPREARDALSGDDGEIAALFEAWSDALLALESRGWADDAAIARRAAAAAPAAAARRALILHHGAYDLTGAQSELVAALDRGREVVALVPDRAFTSFTASSPGAAVRGADLDGLLAGKSVAFAHAQGAGAELELACRRALAEVGAGSPPHEVAVLLRSFGPYAGAVEALAARREVSWSTSFATPLRRDPKVASVLAAARGDAGAPALPWGRHAARLEEARRAAFGSDGGAAARRVAEILGAMAAIEEDLGDRRPVQRDEAAAWLEGAVDAAAVALGSAEGPRLLDLMQARGLTFRHVALVGLNAGVFPRVGRADPFLPDAARRAIRAATGRAVPIPTDTEAEERLLLALACGSAAETLHVSWRRADESGRPVVPSLLLRDLGRSACGTSDADALARLARTLPAHPERRLGELAADPGLLDRDEEALLTALAAGARDGGGEALAARRPEWADGASWTEAVESFRPYATPCDGRAAAPFPGRLGVSALETLGRCPLQFFFKHVVRVPEPEEAPGPFERPPAAVGRKIHLVLRDAYARLLDEGSPSGEPAAARGRVEAMLRALWESIPDDGGGEPEAALPVLERIDASLRLEALAAFVVADLDRLREHGLRLRAFERELEGSLTLPSGGSLPLAARLDRVAEGAGRVVVGDYKTGRSLAGRVDEGAMLSATQMQVPLYALLAGAEVEILGVGPVARRSGGEDPRFVPFPGFSSAERRAGFLESVEIVAGLARRGVFPMRPDRHCAWCAYRPACRRGHPASTFREERAEDAAGARKVWGKSKTKPFVANVAEEGDA